MPMKTKIIGTRIPVVLYQQLEKCAGDSRTLGEVFKEALERYCFPSGSKPVINRSNTVNATSSVGDIARRLQSAKSDRSDSFEV